MSDMKKTVTTKGKGSKAKVVVRLPVELRCGLVRIKGGHDQGSPYGGKARGLAPRLAGGFPKPPLPEAKEQV